ncbi:hypothetical protein Bca4012_050146 [Brassica carinata]|uniref:Uncharacterized protein n=1 Tax=Brassica carinata TaxID=52824 RepID=A0A8X7R814_BRACI|nr:hypothetical protein Bca52824_052893 [Brassica carinata]
MSFHVTAISQAWKGTMWLADLTGSGDLELLPDLSDAVNLEESMTQGCKRLEYTRFGELSSHEFETLPSSIRGLSSLGTPYLHKCKKLKSESLRYVCSPGTEVPSDPETGTYIAIETPQILTPPIVMAFDAFVLLEATSYAVLAVFV